MTTQTTHTDIQTAQDDKVLTQSRTMPMIPAYRMTPKGLRALVAMHARLLYRDPGAALIAILPLGLLLIFGNIPSYRNTPQKTLGGRTVLDVFVPTFAAMVPLMLALMVLFTALGIWQVERLGWKLDLIARVEAAVKAEPSPMPPPAQWPTLTEQADAYRHVEAHGTLLHRCETLVQALTDLGGGYWVMTPLETEQGIVLVDRGFVPSERRDPSTRAAAQVTGAVTVLGLMRMSEPNGTFLRRNDPAGGRWYSRDVEAIAGARHLGAIAPYFIDADKSVLPAGAPVGGLTIVHFRNAHLQYAITWFALAAVVLIAFGVWLRGGRRA